MTLVSAYVRIAGVFLNLKNLIRAEEYILKAIQLAEKNNYKIRNSSVAQIYARILMAQNNLDQAKQGTQKSIEFLVTTTKYNSLSNAYHLLTEIHLKEKDLNAALTANEKSFEFFDENALDSKVRSLQNRGKINLSNNNYNNVITTANQIFKLIENKKLPVEKKNAHQLAASAYEKLNQHKKSNFHLNQFMELKDSIFHSEQISLATSLESKFNREEKEKEIAVLDSKNQIQATLLSQQKNF